MSTRTFEYGNDVAVTWNLWWGTQGDRWALLVDGTVVHTATVARVDRFPQTDVATIDLARGQHELIVRLINNEGSAESHPVTVTIQKDTTDPGEGRGVYEITSHWPGGRVFRIAFAAHTEWEAHVTYSAPMTASVWGGSATVSGNTVVYTPGSYNFMVEGQLAGQGHALPEESYILIGGAQIPFAEMPEPPANHLDTYYLAAADYRPTGAIRLGQVELADVWLDGPLSTMIPNQRKHWAMALAHASQLFLNVSGVDDRYTDGNHYIATAVQESRMGADPMSHTFTYPHPADYPIIYQPAADRDGFQQIEGHNGGSAYAELQALYPNRFGTLNHAEVVSGDRFATSTLTAAYYNIFMYRFLEGAGYRPHAFFNRTRDPQALDRVMALVYNRGAYSTHVSKVFNEAREYCVGLDNMADEAGECLPNLGDFGSLYVRQVPGFNLRLVQAAAGPAGGYPGYYEASISWDDVAFYLDRISVLYEQADMDAAHDAAHAAFVAASAGADTISFAQQFGAVLDAIMLALPVDSPVNKLCEVYAKCEVE